MIIIDGKAFPTIQAFLEDFKLEDVWNFIPIGCSLIQYDLFVLYHRSKKYNIQIDIYKLFREQPIIDIKPILVLLNKMKFKGSSLHNFTKKKTSGENIWSLYENKNYGEIVQYVIEEAKAFMDLFGWLFNSFPDFFRKDYLINNKNSKSNNRNLQENKGGIKCPECGSTFLEKFNELQDGMGIDAMTEGQLAEYLAGTWGTYTCLKCGHDFDYET